MREDQAPSLWFVVTKDPAIRKCRRRTGGAGVDVYLVLSRSQSRSLAWNVIIFFYFYGNFVSRDPASPVESKSLFTCYKWWGGRDPGRISWAFSGIINDHSRAFVRLPNICVVSCSVLTVILYIRKTRAISKNQTLEILWYRGKRKETTERDTYQP